MENRISGKIKVVNSKLFGVKKIISDSCIFKSEVYVNNDVVNGVLTIGKPTPMYEGKTIKTLKCLGGYKIELRCDELQEVEYEFDEESNDDEIYIYYRELNNNKKKI
jgi:hypothetical protein